MTVLFVILPLTLVFSSVFVTAYVWATRTGQLDDLETPPLRAVYDASRSSADDSDDSVEP
jgi:cbb3-type cytochrome oxidase maturation protein